MEKLYIVIPAYNEEENIEVVAREWHEIVQSIGKDSQLVIINDGSTDQTYQKLCELKKELPQLQPLTKSNGGHGSTLLYGYQYALAQGATYIFQTDSDGQTVATDFDKFWQNREFYDALIGFRNHRQDGWSRVFVTKILKLVLRCIFGLTVIDANTPFRLMKQSLLARYIVQVPENFNLTNVMLTVLFLKNHEKVEFYPITFRNRQGGVNSINFKKIIKIGLQAVKDFRQIKRTMK